MKKGKRKAKEAAGFQRSSRQPQIDMTASNSSHRQRGEPHKASSRTKKADQTEQAIIDSAIAFFWNNSFRDLSVKKLMDGTPVSRAAFYQYFVDLYQLMEVLLDSLTQDILTAAGPWLADEGEPIEQLNTSLHGLVHVAYRNGPLLRAISDAAATDARLETSWTNFTGGLRCTCCKQNPTAPGTQTDRSYRRTLCCSCIESHGCLPIHPPFWTPSKE